MFCWTEFPIPWACEEVKVSIPSIETTALLRAPGISSLGQHQFSNHFGPRTDFIVVRDSAIRPFESRLREA